MDVFVNDNSSLTGSSTSLSMVRSHGKCTSPTPSLNVLSSRGSNGRMTPIETDRAPIDSNSIRLERDDSDSARLEKDDSIEEIEDCSQNTDKIPRCDRSKDADAAKCACLYDLYAMSVSLRSIQYT